MVKSPRGPGNPEGELLVRLSWEGWEEREREKEKKRQNGGGRGSLGRVPWSSGVGGYLY